MLVWDELLTKFRSDVENPGLDSPFRGSLIDEKMFSIDVNEWKLANVLETYRKEAEPKIAEIKEPAA